ncbi:MAG: carbohydrate ABC transporter substrate-binding protein [Chloroflexi bacterium]|nr:carbohydrate ABC transporter substrate-binding protein [Chloroflexota bacterium]
MGTKKTMSRREFLRAIGVGTAGLVVVACAPAAPATGGESVTTPAPKATAPPAAKKQVELFWHMTEYEGWANDIMKPLFEEQNPDLELTWTFVNDPENETVLANRMAAGNPPTLFVNIGGPAIQWLKDDLLVDLSQFPELKENLNHFPESAWQFTRMVREISGHERSGIWGTPTMKVMTGVFYDKNRFDELGLGPATTYDEYWDLLAALEDSGKFQHAVAWGNHRWMFFNNFWQIANALIGHDVGEGILTGKYKLDSDEMTEVWQYYEKIAQNGYADKDWMSNEWGITESNFANWKYGVILQGPWVFGSYTKINPEVELRPFPFPTKDGNNRAWVGFLEDRNWWMPKIYPDRDVQVRAMEWITSESYADHQLEDAGIMPMYEKKYKGDSPVIKYMDAQGFPIASQANDTANLFVPPGKQGFYQFGFENLPKLTSGELTAAEYGTMFEDYYKAFRPT